MSPDIRWNSHEEQPFASLDDYTPPQMFSRRTATTPRRIINSLRPESPKSRRGGVSSYVVSPLPAVPTKEVVREVLPQRSPAKTSVPFISKSKDGNVIKYDLVSPTPEEIVRSIEGKKPLSHIEPSAGK